MSISEELFIEKNTYETSFLISKFGSIDKSIEELNPKIVIKHKNDNDKYGFAFSDLEAALLLGNQNYSELDNIIHPIPWEGYVMQLGEKIKKGTL